MHNQIENIIRRNIHNIFLFIISICIVCFFTYLSRYCTFYGDDSFFAVYSHAYETYFDCLFGDVRTEHGGYYIGLFLCKFLSFGLPNLMGIHPADFVGVGHGFIRGIFTCICLYLISRFSVVHSGSKSVLAFIFLFLSCYFFWNGMNSNIIVINYNFYRYFFSLIFFSCFVHFLYKNMIFEERKNKSWLKLLLIILCGFVIGTSIEITFFTSLTFVSLIILYNLFLNGLLFIKPNERIKCCKYNLDINFYLPVIGLIIGTFLFTTTDGFKSVASDRGIANIVVTLSDLKEFSLLYWNVCFQNEYLYWILFLILFSLSVYFSIKNKELKKVLFPIFIQISVLIIIFSLVLCGKTFDEVTRDRFFLCHGNIVFLYKMLIIPSILIIGDYVIYNLVKANYKYNKIIYALLILILLLGSSLYIQKIVKFLPYVNSNYYMPAQKRMYYIMEKLYRFYIIREEMPILPDYYKASDGAMYPYYRNINLSENPINNLHLPAYYIRVYNKPTQNYQFVMEKNAIEEFYAKGGVLTDEELKKLNFTKLLDDDFVLNRNSI